MLCGLFFFFKQKTAYEMRISDWSSDVCSSDLLLATGASPVHLDIPGSSLPHVHYLRTAADSRNLVAATVGAKRAVIIGASFIGLEVAASLRARGIEVHVVGKDTVLMEADVEVDGDLQERNCTII